MRWTCVSTQMPGRPNANVTTRFAVLRPTPWRLSSASRSEGTRPAKRSSRSRRYPVQHARLRAIEPDGVDRALDRAQRQGEHRRRRVGEGEEARRGRSRRLVLRAQREETPDQDAEGIAAALPCDRREGGRVPRRRGTLEARDDAAHGPRVGQARRHGRSGGRGQRRRRRELPAMEHPPERLVRRGGFLEGERRPAGEGLDAHRAALDRRRWRTARDGRGRCGR